jgi:hypothetical protein
VREQFKSQGAHFLSAAEADQLAKVVATPQRSLNPAIVGKSVEAIAKMAGLTVPPGTRCLIADVAGVGRDHPLSMEKLSPILAFYVAEGRGEVWVRHAGISRHCKYADDAWSDWFLYCVAAVDDAWLWFVGRQCHV